MHYASNDMTDLMGLGAYVGEIRQGPDGHHYEWVEGVDGVGNPIGFWKVMKRIGRGVKRAAQHVAPLVKKYARPLARAALPFTKFIPGVGPAIYAAGTVAQRAGLLGAGEVGEIAQGEDGQLYQYVEGVDGLGNPVGFWKPLRRLASRAKGLIPKLVSKIPFAGRVKRYTGPFCQQLPRLQPCVQQIPQAGPAYDAATKVCRVLKRVGLAGPNGEPYELVEGIGEFGEPVRLIIPAQIRRRQARPGPAA